ncbi:hypothetical protein GpartN1_g4407.t1 [Galdieria partita]|uniref:Uncharacterized protein n=1 Tax=Galdieria partita TaxID=83374 RepID=A0A9C7PZ94_9RHOD|nr:hypothetical protein GpartN1_g4407.t1 [Galdieria partita]
MEPSTHPFLQLIQSPHIQDKWRGLVMATDAIRNWTEEEILAVLENVGNSFLVALLESNEREDIATLEKTDLIALSLSLLASSCTSHKVCQGKFWSELLPHLANIIFREYKRPQRQDGVWSESVVNCWIVICSVCSTQEELLHWFLRNSSLQNCMFELCKHIVKNESVVNSQRQEQMRQLVKEMSCLGWMISNTVEDTRERMLLPYMLLVVMICLNRFREPSFRLDIIHQVYLLSPHFCRIFGHDKQHNMKNIVWKMDEHLRTGIECFLSNRLNDALRQKLFTIVVEELKVWKLYDFDFGEKTSSISSLFKYMRFLLFMCSVELGVHLREVLRAPMDSLENENNRQLHLVNIFQIVELCIEFFQRRMVETEERHSESLRAEEMIEVKAMEALVENIQVVVDFLESEPLKSGQQDYPRYTRLSKYFLVGLRVVCCFSILQLPVLEERISTVLVHSWNNIMDNFQVVFTHIDGDIFYNWISWTRSGVKNLVAYSDVAITVFESEVFSKVWIQLLQEFINHTSSMFTMVTEVIHDIIDLLACLYEFPCNRRYIQDHESTLMSFQTYWPLERWKTGFMASDHTDRFPGKDDP